MPGFRTSRLTAARDAVAPDGSDMRILLRLTGGGMAHFALPPGETSTAVTHRTVEEIWFILSGRAVEEAGGDEEIVSLEPGVCLTLPLVRTFSFGRSAIRRSRQSVCRCRRGRGRRGGAGAGHVETDSMQ